ncbi:AAA family ATPase [Streptomyces spectabilis]|uniref:AAA family ATPase n=1 Tax=Streptomyces spectabilis TaxID=68270 RepID=UPI0033ED6794
MTFTFTPATREQARARIGLQGPAGSGKTKTALRLAEGLAQGGQIGVADTERGSALKYAVVPGKPELGGHVFGHLPMDRHDPRDLIQVVRAAEEAGLAVLVVDSWSHFWNGRGGLLEIVEQAGSERGAGGTFGGWRTGNPIEQEMLDALLNFRGHLIVTMRTKGDYVIEGKKVTKVGVKAVQREGAEYELDVVMDMVEGTATVTKTRYEPLNGQVIHHPGEDVAELILEQLGQGVDPVQLIVDELVGEGLTYEQALELHGRAKARGILDSGLMHPVSGEPTTLGDLIREYGQAVKPGATPVTTSQPSSPQPSESTPAKAPSTPDSERVTPPQMRLMHATFNQLGFTERDDRLRATSLIVGHAVPSANNLTAAEAKTLLDTLTAYAARENGADDFVAMLDGLDEDDKQSAA